jgi:hypothetical protein
LFILRKKKSLSQESAYGVPVIEQLTSSYLAISSSTTGVVTGAGASVAAGTGGATLVLVLVEPGLGGREGCRGELEGRGAVMVDGVGSGRAAGLSTLMTELTSGVTTMVGGGAGGFAAVALALASAEILSSLLFRSAIFPSSNLIFFTKSLTSPGLVGIQY